MNYLIPKYILDVYEKIESEGFEVFVVGGAVRDLIMGRIVDDWDLTTSATPEEILKILPDAFYENSFGTVMLSVEELSTPIDITTYRTEHGYSDSRRPDKVEWGNSIEEDLKRRDFTVNAIAIKITNTKGDDYATNFIDPHNGREDLETKLIRTVGDPNERFAEDALRMMRAVRIATEIGFEIETNTKDAINVNAYKILNISAERIRDELFKILLSPRPELGISMLREVSLMNQILPEIDECFGVEQKSPQRHHIDDVGTHLVKSLKECKSEDVITRFAVLIHDIGKPPTRKVTKEGVTTFYNHEIVGAKIANNVSDRLKFSKKQRDKLWRLVRYHQFSVTEKQNDSAIRRFIRNVGVDLVPDMLELRRSDRLGSGAAETSWRTEDFIKRIEEVQKLPFSVKDLKINGNDVMKELDMKPGPEVGRILNELFNKVEKKEIENEISQLTNTLINFKPKQLS